MILSHAPKANLVAVSSAMPPHVVDREATTASLLQLFPAEDPDFVRGLVENSGVHTRHIALPVEVVLRGHNFTERNAFYQAAATELAVAAARRALDRAGIDASEIGALIDVSCTGVMIPALDVELAERLAIPSSVRRIPITEAGCSAGALGISLAAQLAQLGVTTLVVAVELCSLTLCQEDRTRTNLVASVLFGDGAAAAVVAPDASGPEIRAVGSHLFEKSKTMMGFDVGTHGLRIVLQRELPLVLKQRLRGAIDAFLETHARDADDIGLHLVHPGGRRILETYTELFDLAPEALAHSREALRRYGNLSSASILTVLELALEAGTRPSEGREALVLGIGPGLAAEMMILGWKD
jgi:alkylresorcinol/alkylpyrone synthase